MKIFVTGAEGQLARSLSERALFHPDVELIAVGRPQLDLATPGSAAEAIAAVCPDFVINAAAYTAVDHAEDEPELAFRVNADGAAEVAAAAARLGAPVVQVSTDYVFDGRKAGAYVESDEPSPLGVYGRSKLAGEEAVRDANDRHIIVRTAWVYSPYGRNFVKTMIEAARARDVLNVVDDQVGSPTSALDLADGLLRLASICLADRGRSIGQIYHLAGAGTTSWCGLAQLVMAECRRHGSAAAEITGISTSDWPTKAVRPANSALDSSKFAREFDFHMPQWQESAARVVARLAKEQRRSQAP